ncbi:MAG: hypothetical protein GX683_03445 [Ruminococcaceae bacterium]|nr:hypothetical protein [Oscillospiraceae bacterium]
MKHIVTAVSCFILCLLFAFAPTASASAAPYPTFFQGLFGGAERVEKGVTQDDRLSVELLSVALQAGEPIGYLGRAEKNGAVMLGELSATYLTGLSEMKRV